MIQKALACFCFLTLSLFSHANYKLKLVHQDKDIIWGIDFFDSTHLVYSLKSKGQLVFLNTVNGTSQKLDIPESVAKGQGGLLDVKIYKDHLYFTLTVLEEDTYTTALAKGKIKDYKISSYQIIFKAKVKSDTGRHFGSRLVFVDDTLFMTVGDRGERKYAQDLDVHNGKVLRLDLNGQAISSNPFSTKPNALREIFSYGHRNPQGLSYNANTKTLFEAEFGPRGGDELNIIEPGKNYGWPVITYGKEYWGPKIGEKRKEGMEQPLVHWTPSISPSGMDFYHNAAIKEFKDQLFMAALGSEHVRRIVVKDNKVVSQNKMFEKLKERFRQVRNGPDGYLYFTTDSGKIFKLISQTK